MYNFLSSLPNGVRLLFINSFLMSLGFYALIPYLSYHLTANLMWTPLLIGVLLMVRQFSQQGLTFFSGMFADRLGYKMMLTMGLLIRGFGFSLFAFVDAPPYLFLAALITGLGGAVFEPTSNAALSTLTPVTERSRIYSIKKVIGNIGIGCAALLGAFLINFDFMFISLVCGGIFMFAALITYLFLPNIHVQVETVPLKLIVKTVLHDTYFVFFTLITVGFYFLYMQLFLTIPLKVVELTNQAESVSFVYLLLSILIIVGQYPINRFSSRFDLFVSMRWGVGLMGIGIFILGTSEQMVYFLLGFLIFVIGIMVTEPSVFDFISRYAPANLMATYFGFASLAMALGGGLSQGAGGFLLQTGRTLGLPNLLWWIALIVSLVSIIGLGMIESRQSEVNAPFPKFSRVQPK